MAAAGCPRLPNMFSSQPVRPSNYDSKSGFPEFRNSAQFSNAANGLPATESIKREEDPNKVRIGDRCYQELLKKYDEEGISHLRNSLLRGFELERKYSPEIWLNIFASRPDTISVF